jgi:hypothetical protein
MIKSRFLFLCVCLSQAPHGFAQNPRGAITGVVSDTSEAAVPGVEVRATNVATSVTATAKSNAVGKYTIPFLLPGTYTVAGEATGFKRFVRDGIQVRVSETVEVNIQMELGGVAETIEVKAETPLLDTASASLGQIIDERRALELPMTAGNPLQLMLLAPGITEPSTFLWKPAFNFRQLSADGNGVTNNEFQIDGVSNTFSDSTSGQTRYAFAPPQSSVSEFKVQTAAYDAAVGHTIGALVNVITKSGTNRLHGEVHWFVRNGAFDAPSFLTIATTQNLLCTKTTGMAPRLEGQCIYRRYITGSPTRSGSTPTKVTSGAVRRPLLEPCRQKPNDEVTSQPFSHSGNSIRSTIPSQQL